MSSKRRDCQHANPQDICHKTSDHHFRGSKQKPGNQTISPPPHLGKQPAGAPCPTSFSLGVHPTREILPKSLAGCVRLSAGARHSSLQRVWELHGDRSVSGLESSRPWGGKLPVGGMPLVCVAPPYYQVPGEGKWKLSMLFHTFPPTSQLPDLRAAGQKRHNFTTV